jgi:hypothetical protein
MNLSNLCLGYCTRFRTVSLKSENFVPITPLKGLIHNFSQNLIFYCVKVSYSLWGLLMFVLQLYKKEPEEWVSQFKDVVEEDGELASTSGWHHHSLICILFWCFSQHTAGDTSLSGTIELSGESADLWSYTNMHECNYNWGDEMWNFMGKFLLYVQCRQRSCMCLSC